MSDRGEAFLRAQAKVLVADMLRYPFVALSYQDAVFDAIEDSNGDVQVARWLSERGYSTRVDYITEALAGVREHIADFWAGAYLISVGKKLVALEIDGTRVSADGGEAVEGAFSAGVLNWKGTDAAPWNGVLRFSDSRPDEKQGIAAGLVLQKKCTGKLWMLGDAEPSTDNAAGVTRVIRIPSRTDSAAASAPDTATRARRSASSEEDPPPPPIPSGWADFGRWNGTYKVQVNPDVTKDHWEAGLDYRVDIHSNAGTLTYQTSHSISLATTDVHPAENRIVYATAERHFDLSFADFGDGRKAFSGKIYKKSAAAPGEANAAGITDLPPTPQAPQPSEWNGPAIAGLVLGILGILASGVTSFIIFKFQPRLQELFERRREEKRLERLGEVTTDVRLKIESLTSTLGDIKQDNEFELETLAQSDSDISEEFDPRTIEKKWKDVQSDLQVLGDEISLLKDDVDRLTTEATTTSQELESAREALKNEKLRNKKRKKKKDLTDLEKALQVATEKDGKKQRELKKERQKSNKKVDRLAEAKRKRDRLLHEIKH